MSPQTNPESGPHAWVAEVKPPVSMALRTKGLNPVQSEDKGTTSLNVKCSGFNYGIFKADSVTGVWEMTPFQLIKAAGRTH